MRASPAFRVRIERYGVWQVGVGMFCAGAAASLAAWLWQLGDARSLREWLLAAAGAATIGAAIGCMRCRPSVLRWDGRDWWLEPHDSHRPRRGRIDAPIDLANWMLLRFVAAPSERLRVSWIPVQRRGLEAEWHAMRCAVHAGVPAVQSASPEGSG